MLHKINPTYSKKLKWNLFFFSNKVEPNGNDGKKAILDPEVSNAEQYKEQKRKSKIKKLEKAQKKCSREIRKLEEKEMSLDDLDDEDSTYLKVCNLQNAWAGGGTVFILG